VASPGRGAGYTNDTGTHPRPTVNTGIEQAACQHGSMAPDDERADGASDSAAALGRLVDRERERAERARRRMQEESSAMARGSADDRAVHELAREVNERAVALHERAVAVFEEARRLRPRPSTDGARA